jgi:hypothetical protein
MGAQSDSISEEFVPSESYKAQQSMISATLAAASPEGNVHLTEPKLLPHLVDYQGAKRCSVCKMLFPPDARPSMSTAFAEHVLKAHQESNRHFETASLYRKAASV